VEGGVLAGEVGAARELARDHEVPGKDLAASAGVGAGADRGGGEVRPFRAALAGLGSFPSRRRGRVLWAGLEDDGGGLTHLATVLDEALIAEFPVETRRFHPHLTVARSDPPLSLPPAFAETALETEAWEIEHVVLFRSHIRRPAPIYEPIRRFRLGEREISGGEVSST
jgi:2'-5' RNA ligase